VRGSVEVVVLLTVRVVKERERERKKERKLFNNITDNTPKY